MISQEKGVIIFDDFCEGKVEGKKLLKGASVVLSVAEGCIQSNNIGMWA